jgi:glycerol-3-phosphate dehydrogenase
MPEIAEVDVVILGGGINGCGTFRDLALQGFSALLLERGDFCQGASAASSRLMHGGLKYLETGEFRLVREALTERNMLLSTAPHYVQPLECVVPVRSVWGGTGAALARMTGLGARLCDRGFVLVALGLWLYDLFGRSLRTLPASRMAGQKRLGRMMPDLARGITGAGIYHEARITHAERLGLELVLDALEANPRAQAETHARLIGAEAGVLVWQDAAGQKRRTRAKAIINAGGAWIDQVNACLGLKTALMGVSRGSHLVMDNPALLAALGGRMVYFGTPDGRVNLAYPFQGRVLVGATDIAQTDPDAATCDDDEERYLLAAVREVFPDIPIIPDQVVHRFCGVRPLPRADGPVGGITRDHSIVTLALPDAGVPVHCLIGGKWTTFRAFAEAATDRVLADLGVRRSTTTAGLAIGGGQGFPTTAKERAEWVERVTRLGDIPPHRAEDLLARYGTRAEDYVSALDGKGETMLATLPDFAAEEIAHIVRTERVGRLDDLIYRRSLIGLSGRDSDTVRSELATILGKAGLALAR